MGVRQASPLSSPKDRSEAQEQDWRSRCEVSRDRSGRICKDSRHLALGPTVAGPCIGIVVLSGGSRVRPHDCDSGGGRSLRQRLNKVGAPQD